VKLYEIVESAPGYIIVEDGTLIVVRVIIGFIEEVGETPTGPNFRIAHRVFLYADAPKELKDQMASKPFPTGDFLKDKEIWKIVKIKGKKAAYEECLYEASDGRKYRIRLEIEPAIVARTLHYRDVRNNPIYNVRWSIKQSVSLID